MKKLILLFSGVAVAFNCFATNVTGFTGAYRNGQVFFTWNNITTSSNATYRLYRSSTKITKGSQLASCEYLGYTNQNSANNNNLTKHDSVINHYWIIKTGGTPLASTQGLFVSTSVANGSWYYALTTYVNKEDTAIIVGTNSLSNPIAEIVSTPQPVLQEIRMIEDKPVEIYGDFLSSRITLNGPLRFKAGWLGYDFAVYRNNAVSPQALHVRFHAGGADFLTNITKVNNTELNLGVEDYFPDDENSGWLGSHELFDPYKKSNNSVPSTGTNYFYSLERILSELNWVIANFPVDSNRVVADGISFGSYGAFFFSLLHPEKIAAVELTSGIFNFGFLNDYNPECTMNTGQKNRADGDKKFGLVSTNLPEGGGLLTYNALNGGLMIHQYNFRSYPVIFSTNGRNDDMLGWTEKTIWYDSINNNHFGGWYFFDERDHAGDGKTWVETTFDMYRYRKNVSYPAFSDCSLNDNPGNGNGGNGDPVGQINGFLDWNTSITDDSENWIIKLFMHDLSQINNTVVPAPATCTATITPRRLQHFNPPAGATLLWSVKHSNQVVQSGSLQYSGGLITIPSVQIYKDTSVFQLTFASDTFYLDADADGYGNPASFVLAASQPMGYVTDHTDCNDGTASIHPGATELCNNIDDNCNNNIDDGTTKPTAKILPQGNLNICSTGSVVLKAKNGTGTQWQWKKNNNNISGATQQSYTATSTGDYTVKVTSPEGCTKKSKKVTVTSSCRNQNGSVVIDEKMQLQLSPNPASDVVYVEINFGGNEIGLVHLQLVNILGQPVRSSFVQVMQSSGLNEEISLEGIPAGTYFIHVTFNGNSIVERLGVSSK